MRWRIEEYLKQKATESVSIEEFIEWVAQNNLLDYSAVRNMALREHYHALPNKSRYEAKLQTADFFCLSEAQTHRILFDKRYRKK